MTDAATPPIPPAILTQTQEPLCKRLQDGIVDGIARTVEAHGLATHTFAPVTPVALTIVLAEAIIENRTRGIGGPDLEDVIGLLRRIVQGGP